MENRVIVRVAVDTELLMVDKLYDYRLPAAFCEKARPGMRVLVPFGKGNSRCEALILQIVSESAHPRLKSVDALLDTEPVLDEEREWRIDMAELFMIDIMREGIQNDDPRLR